MSYESGSVQEIPSEIIELQIPLEPESDVDFQVETEPKVVVPAAKKQRRSKLLEERQKVGELTAEVTFLQEQLDTVTEITAQQLLAESETEIDFQVEAKSEAVDSALKEQQRSKLEEEQQKVVELMVKVTSLQEQLDTASELVSYIPSASAPEPESVPIDANSKIKRIVEALLFATDQPMTVKQLHAVFPELEAPKKQQIQDALDSLRYDYRDQGIGLHKVASGYRFQVKTDMASWVARLFAEKPPKYSRALLETISIIAYQQPVTRGDIEEIRGVSVSSNMIRTLLEREWISVLAHKEVPGRPALYGTTRQFLDYFNLESLEGMPALEELQALALEGEMEI